MFRRLLVVFAVVLLGVTAALNCRHLSELDRAVVEGRLGKPKAFDPLLQILWERGAAHERNYIDHLTQAGLDVVRIDGIGLGETVLSETLAVMKKGAADASSKGSLSFVSRMLTCPRSSLSFSSNAHIALMISKIYQRPRLGRVAAASAVRAAT